VAITKQVLVTGAGGFSGAYLAQGLVSAGYEVVAIAGRSGSGRLRLDPSRPGRLIILEGDLAQGIPYTGSVEAIIHTASVSPEPKITVSEIIRSNVEGTRRLVEWARQQGVRKFINFSSLSVFGQIDGPVLDESVPRVNPDAYGVSKWLGEQLLADQGEELSALSLRLPGIIGPRAVRNWLATALAAAKEGRDITYYHPTADYNNAVHIDDLCRFIVSLLERDWCGHEMIVLGCADMIKVRDLVSALSAGFGGRSGLREVAPRRPSFTLSIARAQKLYDYRPMAIRYMIERFVEENKD